MPKRKQSIQQGRGQVRIIGGRWRRRQLTVPDAPGLRPTPDRVRETCFNWLAGELVGARCVDLFAGTGALGFEAASRGAARVLLIERAPEIARHLELQARMLDAGDEVEVLCMDAFVWLAAGGERFDLVFVDPPYGSVDLPALMQELLDAGRLADNARVFVETDATVPCPVFPDRWQVLREQRAGRVRYHLAAPPGARI